MLKGYLKADEESVAWALAGALVGSIVGNVVAPKGKRRIPAAMAASAGAIAGLGARAFVDPELKNERA